MTKVNNMVFRLEFLNEEAICDDIIRASYSIVRTYGITGDYKIGNLYVYSDGSNRDIELFAGFPMGLSEITEIMNTKPPQGHKPQTEWPIEVNI